MVRRMDAYTGMEWADVRVAEALDEENTGTPEDTYRVVVRRALEAGGIASGGQAEQGRATRGEGQSAKGRVFPKRPSRPI